MLFKESLIWALWAKMWVQVGLKMAKKAVFTPATLLPTQFSQKTKFLTVIVF